MKEAERIVDQLNFRHKIKGKNLVQVAVQEEGTKLLLTLAHCDREALIKTLTTGKMYYWSVSKNRIRMKGETSGNIQTVKDVRVDCDKDAVLFIIKQKGVACHTGKKTCFFYSIGEKGLEEN